MCTEFEDRLGLAYALREIGKIETAEGRYDDAVATLRRSIAITDEIENRWESAATADDLGNALAALGHLDEAERALERCRRAATERGNGYYAARATGDLGALALRRGDGAGGEELLDAALAHWRRVGHEPYATWVLVQLGHAAAGDPGRRDAAAARYADAVRSAIRHGLAPFALEAVVGAVALGAGGSDEERRWSLQVAANDPAAPAHVRAQAQALLTDAAGAVDAGAVSDTGAVATADAVAEPPWSQVAAAVLASLDR